MDASTGLRDRESSEPWGCVMRRVLAVSVLVSAMLAAVVSSAPPAGGVAGFGDVDTGRFFTEPVQWMVDNEITTGTSPTCFSPDDPVTRGQAAAFMWRMQGFPPPGAAHPFSDVVAPWQQDPVSWMFNNMITTGTTATTYSPDENLTRGQLAALLHRLEGSPAAPPPTQFTDVVKSWQITPVGWMVANDITTGTSPTTFSPEDTVTRGQLAAFFYRYKGSPAVEVDPSSPGCGTGSSMQGKWFRLNFAGMSGSDEIETLDCTTVGSQVQCDYTATADKGSGDIVATGEFSGGFITPSECGSYIASLCVQATFIANGLLTAGPMPQVTMVGQPDGHMVVGWDKPFEFHCPWFTSVADAIAANPTSQPDCVGLT